MKTKITRNQAVLGTVAAMAFIFSVLFFYTNSLQKNKLTKEKIRSEALLSEKLDLEKSMVAFQKELASLKGKNTNLDKIVNETNQKLARKEAEIQKLLTEKVSVHELKKQYADLEAIRSQMQAEIDGLKLGMGQLEDENRMALEELGSIRSNNEYLILQNAMLEAMLADNYRIEALKGKNDKLTVVARKTNTILASFDVPTGFGNQLYFKIITPEEVEISSVDSPFASVTTEEYDDNLMASISGGANAISLFSKRAELIYKPDHKLTKGLYRLNVYDGSRYMGTVQIRLK